MMTMTKAELIRAFDGEVKRLDRLAEFAEWRQAQDRKSGILMSIALVSIIVALVAQVVGVVML